MNLRGIAARKLSQFFSTRRHNGAARKDVYARVRRAGRFDPRAHRACSGQWPALFCCSFRSHFLGAADLTTLDTGLSGALRVGGKTFGYTTLSAPQPAELDSMWILDSRHRYNHKRFSSKRKAPQKLRFWTINPRCVAEAESGTLTLVLRQSLNTAI